MKPTRWLWFPYIPYGKVTLIEGDPGIGKSWLTCELARAVARGEQLPGQEQLKAPLPKKVLLVNGEEDVEDTIAPRLFNMQAPLEMIDYVTEGFKLNEEGIRSLEATVKARDIRLLIIDPIVAYLGADLDMHRANEVRSVMEGLFRIASHTGCAVVVVRHLRKAGGKNPLYAGLGSIDFVAAVRSTVQVIWAKNGKDRVLYQPKASGTEKGKPLAYEIVPGECKVEYSEAGETKIWATASFNWLGNVDMDDFEPPKVNTVPKLKQQAIDFLIQQLSDGPKQAIEVQKAAVDAGISFKTLTRAKQGLAVSDKIDNVWWWKLVPALPSETNVGDADETDSI